VPIIEALTKADITAFFNTYLSPASPRRAKLSVHMVAQKTAPAAAAVPELTDAEKREKLRAALAQALAANGLAADEDKLVAHLAAVDLSSEQQPPPGPPFADAAQAVESLGVRVAGAGGEAGGSRDGGLQEALERAGPAVGKAWAEAWAAVRAGAKTVEEVVKVAVEPVWIEDGHAFRSRLEATCSVQPVRSVSDFEDTEPKL
jgi:insulysin